MYLCMSCVARTCASLVSVILDMQIMLCFLWYIWYGIWHTPAGVMSYIYMYIYIYTYTCIMIRMIHVYTWIIYIIVHICAYIHRSCWHDSRRCVPWPIHTWDTCAHMNTQIHVNACIYLCTIARRFGLCVWYMGWIVHIYRIYKAIHMYIYTQTHTHVYTYLYTHMYIQTHTQVYVYCTYIHTRSQIYVLYSSSSCINTLALTRTHKRT